MTTVALHSAPFVDDDVAERLDAIVERAGAAAVAFRALDQEAVDRIVHAMVVAGLRHAVELARLAMEETGFEQDADAMAAFKKTLPYAWRKSARHSRLARQ